MAIENINLSYMKDIRDVIEQTLNSVQSIPEFADIDSALNGLTGHHQLKGPDLEYALHTYTLDLVQQQDKQKLAAMVDLATALSNNGTTDSAFVFNLLEEVMDMVDLSTSQALFACMERRTSILRKDIRATGGKGIVMLRMCNNLLRRIPQRSMAEFAGQVQLFVANSFPLSERSGVNLRGEFDQKNIAQPYDEEYCNEEDQKLYYSFWSLQQAFANPQTICRSDSSKGKFEEFIAAATLTVDEFRKTNSSKAPQISLDPAGAPGSIKFLTSPVLLRMQMADPQLKCQILLQLLIFIKYVLSVSGDRLVKLREVATNKLLLGNVDLGLTEADLATLRDLRKRASSQLVGAANDHGLFSRTAQFVLFHENHWFKWKAESCKPFEGKPAPELVEVMQRATQAFLAISAGSSSMPNISASLMGSSRLAELWESTPTDIESLEGLGFEMQSIDLPSAMQKLDIFCQGDDDYDLLTASEQTQADVLQWRALRSSVRDNMFRKVDPASRSLAMIRDEILPKSNGEAMDVVN